MAKHSQGRERSVRTSASSRSSRSARAHSQRAQSERAHSSHTQSAHAQSAHTPWQSQRASADRQVTRSQGKPVRSPLTDVALYIVVFLGGSLGTAARYALSQSMNSLPELYSIHWGTLAANIIASFVYAFLTALIAGSIGAKFAPAGAQRAGELISRGLGMGFCGGLSTMSTLALEITAGQMGWVYAVVSVVLGVLCAFLGAALGQSLTKSTRSGVSRGRHGGAAGAENHSAGRHTGVRRREP